MGRRPCWATRSCPDGRRINVKNTQLSKQKKCNTPPSPPPRRYTTVLHIRTCCYIKWTRLSDWSALLVIICDYLSLIISYHCPFRVILSPECTNGAYPST